MLDLIGTGMLEMKCSDKNFTKSGQDILLNVSDCVDPGVTIGENTVVGAGSVVTRDLPAGVLAAGAPCRPVRTL